MSIDHESRCRAGLQAWWCQAGASTDAMWDQLSPASDASWWCRNHSISNNMYLHSEQLELQGSTAPPPASPLRLHASRVATAGQRGCTSN